MSKKLTTSDRIYQGQAAARLSMLRRMRRELVDDITRLDVVIQGLRNRFHQLTVEIAQEESQWREDK